MRLVSGGIEFNSFDFSRIIRENVCVSIPTWYKPIVANLVCWVLRESVG